MYKSNVILVDNADGTERCNLVYPMDIDTDVTAIGDSSTAKNGECAFMDGATAVGEVCTDELTTIGELKLALKIVGDLAIGVIASSKGDRATCVI